MNLDHIQIEFKKQAAPACMSYGKNCTKINIRLPISYTFETIYNMLNHEIGTHYVRKYNHALQPFYKKEKFDYLQDEEGLAALNTYFESATPVIYKAALNYYSAYLASCHSFKEMFILLEPYLLNPEKR